MCVLTKPNQPNGEKNREKASTVLEKVSQIFKTLHGAVWTMIYEPSSTCTNTLVSQ